MRRPFTIHEAEQRNITSAALRWGVSTGKWQRVIQGVYLVACSFHVGEVTEVPRSTCRRLMELFGVAHSRIDPAD